MKRDLFAVVAFDGMRGVALAAIRLSQGRSNWHVTLSLVTRSFFSRLATGCHLVMLLGLFHELVARSMILGSEAIRRLH